MSGQASAASDFAGIGGAPTAPAAPAYGAPAAPGYGAAPTPANTPPWNGNNGINPITGQPM